MAGFADDRCHTPAVGLCGVIKHAWGEELATAVLEAIPPMASSDIATKQDIENMAVQLRGEMAALRGEVVGEFRASTRHTIVAAAVSIWLSLYLPAVL